MPDLNVLTLNRDYVNVIDEDIYISYPNCMISTPNRFASINGIIYPNVFSNFTNSGIVNGLYLTITQNSTQNIINITQGVIKVRHKLVFIKNKSFTVNKSTIQSTFPNTNNLNLNLNLQDNIINDFATENYIDAYYQISDAIVNPINDTNLSITLYRLTKDSNGNLYVDYDTSLQYRLL